MKKVILIGGVILVVVGLIVWGKALQKDAVVFFGDTNVACLDNGHQQIELHIHPVLRITVDGEEEAIPANIGIQGACMSETHTHDATGVLHIETATRERFEQLQFTDFFDVWGRDIERSGYTLEAFVNGTAVASVEDIPLEDGDQIELRYTSIESAGE